MIRTVTTDARYETILERSTPSFTEAINSVVRAYLGKRSLAPSLERLGLVIGRNIALSTLLGRESAARAARAVIQARGSYADNPVAIVPKVPFTEAIHDIIERTPEVARFGTPEAVRRIIERDGFTLARASEPKIVERVQKALADFLQRGVEAPDAAEVIAEMGDWTREYGEVVYRTNIARAFSTGRFDQLREPEMREAIPALRYSAVGDHDTRENHKAADGLIAPSDAAIWTTFRPPLGFSCRCSVDFVDFADYEEMRRNKGFLNAAGIHYPPNFHNAHPDPGFVTGGR